MIFEFTYEDTTYEFDDDKMSLGEARWIKQATGLVGSSFFEAARKLDPDAILAILVMAMRRAGLKDTEMDAIYADDEDGYIKLVQGLEVKQGPRVVKKRTSAAKE